MTSLSYHAEHRAWQERVLREATESVGQRRSEMHSKPASRLATGSRSLEHKGYRAKYSLRVAASPQSSSNRPASQYQSHRPWSTIYSSSYIWPAEVRGKYAPPSALTPILSDSEAHKNPLLSRPVTSGALVRKSCVDTGLQVNLSRPSTSRSQASLASKNLAALRPVTVAPRPMTVASNKSLKVEELPKGEIPQDVLERVAALQAAKEEVPAVEDEQPALSPEEPVEPTQDNLSRPATATTWKTTSSQRRYIDELERLLNEERKRRVLAEAKLTSVLPDNSSRLVPYLCAFLSRYPTDKSDSSAQLLLRVVQDSPLLLTDGFYTVEAVYAGEPLDLNLFIKALTWTVRLGVSDLVLELKSLERIGHEKMQTSSLPLVKLHPEVLRLLTPALRHQVAARIPTKTREEVQVMLKLFEDHEAAV